MAATAMDQDRLKAAAGIKNSGRKSRDHVLHFTLSWHPDESANVSRDEMLRAAHGAIRALKADDHQALIVSHNDEPQAHVHILLNRVNPTDGRILSSSKEKLALSAWAEAYEKERGQVFCEERVINNAARRRGEFTRGRKNQARHLYEQEAANSNNTPAEAVRGEQRRKDAEVARRAREIRDRHAKSRAALAQQHRQRLADIRAKAKRDVVLAREAVRERFRPEWRMNFHEEQAELRAFEQREEHFVGRVQNALKAIDFGAIVRGQDRRRAIGDAFQALAQAGARLEGLRRAQQGRAREIAGRQKRDEQAAAAQIRSERGVALAQARASYIKERQTLDMTRAMDGASLRASWKTRREQRAAAWAQEKHPGGGTPPATPERTPTETALIERARLIQAFKDRTRHRATDKKHDKDRERD